MTEPANCNTTEYSNSPETEGLFPEGVPEYRTDTISSLCSHGITPLVMTGFLRQLLIQHFCDPENILSAALRADMQRRGGYNANNPNSLQIEALERWMQGQRSESLPALLIKSHAWEYQRIGIGDMAGGNTMTGETTYYGTCQGSHTVFALAEHGGEALNLATEIFKIGLWYNSLICQQLELLRFLPVNIGEIAAVQESKENYVVPVSFGYVVSEQWGLRPDAPRLKQFVFRASATIPDY